MKKIIVLTYSFLISLSSFAFLGNNIDEKLLRSFKEAFPNAEQVSWNEFSEAYIVTFFEHGIRTRITFGKDGQFVEAFRYYGEQQLPPYLFFNLKKEFPGKQVFGVTEISTVSATAYYVKMVDSKNWITVKLEIEGHWELVEKYKKATL